MTSNYQEQGVDLDYTYVNANDQQYFPLEVLNVTGRKIVSFGQNYNSTYPYSKLGGAFNLSSVNVPKVDYDNVSLLAALPTGVVYQDRQYPYETKIRGDFSKLENYPQTDPWQYTINNTSRYTPILLGNINENRWSRVVANRENSAFLKSDGSWWVCGYNGYGDLGVNTNINAFSPVQFSSTNVWSDIQYGKYHSSGVKTDGTLWTWGRNNIGQLGNNSSLPSIALTPTQIGSDKSWVSCSSGGFSSFAISSDGTLWAWGRNNSAELGNSATVNLSSPVQISNSKWKQVTCGYNFSLAINSQGTLWGWGQNGFGQLGTSGTTTLYSPIQIGALSDWSQVSCSPSLEFSGAVKNDGTLWMWGRNVYGQLGLSDTTSRSSPTQVGSLTNWSKICCGSHMTIALKTDGTLWTWGLNQIGALGISSSSTLTVYSPVQIGTKSDWTQSTVGDYHTVALDSNGQIYVWGYNNNGPLGLQQNGTLPTKLDYGI